MIKYIQFLVLFLFVKINYISAQSIIYANDGMNNLYSIDIKNCKTELIGNLTYTFLDIAYNPIDGYIYGINNSDSYLYKINPQNGSILSKLPIIFPGNSLIIDTNGLFYGFSGSLFTLNINTLQINYISNSTNYEPAGDFAFLNGLTLLSTTQNELIGFNEKGEIKVLNNSETIWYLTYGLTTINERCKSEAFAFSYNNIYKIDPQTYNLSLLCEDIGVFFGATSTSESINNFSNDCESVLEMPNIFTPNSDSLNDYFKPIIIKNINELTIQIFNRWGEVVYESNDLSFKWDGYKVSDGIYYWYIKYNDFYDKEFQQKGYVQLVR